MMIVYVNQLSLIFAILFVMAGMTMAYTDQCTGPSLDGQHNNASSELLCAILCKASGDCSSFLFKEWDDFVKDDDPNLTGYKGNCIIRTKYEDNFMGEIQRQVPGFKLFVGIWNRKKFNYVPGPNIDARASAKSYGFNLELKIPGSDSTWFLRRQNTKTSYEGAERWCASRGGHVIHEYNSNISDAINEMFKDSPIPVRHQGIRGQDTTKLLWTNMLAVHKSLVAQCPIFQDFVWGQATGHVVDTIANGLKPGGASPLPSSFICQYIGPNISKNKPAFASHSSDAVARNVNNGKWGGSRLDQYGTHNWFYIDLGDRYAVKMFLFNGRIPCCASRNKDWRFYVGDTFPVQAPMEVSKFTYCTRFPWHQPLRGFNGATCDHLVAGRYAIVWSTYGRMNVYETAVFGFPMTAFNVSFLHEVY